MHGDLCQYTLVFVSPFYLSLLQIVFFFHSLLHSIEVTLQETVFDEYRISSQNEDRIAFTVDLTLLSRALKSSVSIYGDKLQVKLVRKRPSLSERPMPYLTFESKVRL